MHQQPDSEFAAYVRARYGVLLRSALLLTGDHDLAQDLMQEALIKLASRWDRVKEGNPDAYVRRILYHDNVSRWRRSRHETPIEELGDSQRPVGGRDPVDPGEAVTAIDVRRALRQLTAKQRAVLVLRYYEDLSEAQIAETLGIGRGTVKSQAHVGLKRLREVLPRAAEAVTGREDG